MWTRLLLATSAFCLMTSQLTAAVQAQGYQLPEAPPTQKPAQQAYKKVVLPFGYRLSLPSHFQEINNHQDSKGTWRFQGNNMQIVVTAWRNNGWTAKQIAHESYKNWTVVSNKTLTIDTDATKYYGKKTNASWHYIQGTGVYNNAVRAFGFAGILNPSTQTCVSIRFDWANQKDNSLYANTANTIMNSMEVWH